MPPQAEAPAPPQVEPPAPPPPPPPPPTALRLQAEAEDSSDSDLDSDSVSPAAAAPSAWVGRRFLEAVICLASASLPNLDQILDLDAGTLLNPTLTDQLLNWARPVGYCLDELRKACLELAESPDGPNPDELDELLTVAGRHSNALLTMRTRFEYLALISNLLRKHQGIFGHGGEIYSPHATLTTGYTSSGFRRIVMSYRTFVNWVAQVGLDKVAEYDAVTITHEVLAPNAWQLRLLDSYAQRPALDCVLLADVKMKTTPDMWRMTMVELNSDLLDASKKILLNSVNSAGSQKSDETKKTWHTALHDLLSIMEHRAQLLANRPFSRRAGLAEVTLPAQCQDSHGAPPVVVWVAPFAAPKPPERVVRRRSSEWEASDWQRGDWKAGSSRWRSSEWSGASGSGGQ